MQTTCWKEKVQNMQEEYRGFFWKTETPKEVRDIIADAYQNNRRKDSRIRIIYGNTVTGKAWLKASEVIQYGIKAAGEEGYIGKSGGCRPSPLSLGNNKSIGGPVLLDGSIIRIEKAQGKKVLYQHPKFHWKPEEE